jgi:hypothetical protein
MPNERHRKRKKNGSIINVVVLPLAVWGELQHLFLCITKDTASICYNINR